MDLYQDFFQPEKSRNDALDIVRYFSTCVLYRPLAADMSLAFREMNERQSLHHSQSMAVCQNFLGLWLLKHGKSVLLTVPFKLSMKGKKTKIRKNDSISRGWERKSTTGRFATDRFGCVPERFLLSVRKKPATENFMENYAHGCFCSDSTHFFILSLGANALQDFHSGIVDPFIFIR